MNSRIYYYGYPNCYYPIYTKLNHYKYPTSTVLLCDGNGAGMGYVSPITGGILRHSGGLNILWLDGHVTWRDSQITLDDLDP